jgi:hypothetical protein
MATRDYIWKISKNNAVISSDIPFVRFFTSIIAFNYLKEENCSYKLPHYGKNYRTN